MKEMNKIRLLAGLTIIPELEMRTEEEKRRIIEARKVPNNHKELAGKSRKNMTARVGHLESALKHIDAAQEALDKIPATDYSGDVPSVMSILSDLTDGEEGLRKLLKYYKDEFDVWERQSRAKKEHKQRQKIEQEEKALNLNLPESKQVDEMTNNANAIENERQERMASKRRKINSYVKAKRLFLKGKRAEKVSGRTRTTESMYYNTNGNYPISHEDKDDPINVAKDENNLYYKKGEEFDESPNQLENNPYNESQKVTIPAKIKSALKEQIDEARRESKRFELNRDYDSFNFYNNLANAFEDLLGKIDKGTVYGLKEAQIFMTSLMGPMLHKIPDDVVKFVANGGVTRSLKGYMFDVSKDYPVTGKPYKNPGE